MSIPRPDKTDLPRLIRGLISILQLSIKDIATATKTSPDAVRTWRKGVRNIGPDSWSLLVEYIWGQFGLIEQQLVVDNELEERLRLAAARSHAAGPEIKPVGPTSHSIGPEHAPIVNWHPDHIHLVSPAPDGSPFRYVSERLPYPTADGVPYTGADNQPSLDIDPQSIRHLLGDIPITTIFSPMVASFAMNPTLCRRHGIRRSEVVWLDSLRLPDYVLTVDVIIRLVELYREAMETNQLDQAGKTKKMGGI